MRRASRNSPRTSRTRAERAPGALHPCPAVAGDDRDRGRTKPARGLDDDASVASGGTDRLVNEGPSARRRAAGEPGVPYRYVEAFWRLGLRHANPAVRVATLGAFCARADGGERGEGDRERPFEITPRPPAPTAASAPTPRDGRRRRRGRRVVVGRRIGRSLGRIRRPRARVRVRVGGARASPSLSAGAPSAHPRTRRFPRRGRLPSAPRRPRRLPTCPSAAAPRCGGASGSRQTAVMASSRASPMRRASAGTLGKDLGLTARAGGVGVSSHAAERRAAAGARRRRATCAMATTWPPRCAAAAAATTTTAANMAEGRRLILFRRGRTRRPRALVAAPPAARAARRLFRDAAARSPAAGGRGPLGGGDEGTERDRFLSAAAVAYPRRARVLGERGRGGSGGSSADDLSYGAPPAPAGQPALSAGREPAVARDRQGRARCGARGRQAPTLRESA